MVLFINAFTNFEKIMLSHCLKDTFNNSEDISIEVLIVSFIKGVKFCGSFVYQLYSLSLFIICFGTHHNTPPTPPPAVNYCTVFCAKN